MKNLCKAVGIVALASLPIVSCTSDKYDMENINAEITLAEKGLVLPLGFIEPITLDSLTKTLKIDNTLSGDENGNLQVAIDSSLTFTVEAFDIAPISDFIPPLEAFLLDMSNSNFALPEGGVILPEKFFNYEVNLPEYTINSSATELPAFTFGVPVNLGLGSLVNGATIPAGLTASPTTSGQREINLKFPCPEQIKTINEVSFASSGARVLVELNFNSLGSVLAKKVINNITVNLPDYYTVTLDDNLGGKASVVNGNQVVVNNYDMGTMNNLILRARIKSIDLSHITPTTVDGQRMVVYNNYLTYEVQSTITTKAGTVSLANEPKFNVTIDQSNFGDAEIVTNEIAIDPIISTQALNYTLSGFSPDLSAVLNIRFDDSSNILLSASDLNLPFEGWEESEIKVELPEFFVLDQTRLTDATLNGNVLTTTIGKVTNGGLLLPIKEIDFGDEGAPCIDEKLTINSSFKVEISPVFPSATYLLSEITDAMGPKTMSVGMDESPLFIVPEESQVKLHTITTDISFKEPLKQTINDIPEQLKYIKSVKMCDENGEDVSMMLSLSVSDSPVNLIELQDIEIHLPKCLWIEAEGLDQDNVLHIDKISADFTQSLDINLFDVTIHGIRDVAVENGQIQLDDSIKVYAKAVVPEGDIIHGTFNDIIATPTIEIPTMYIQKVEGNVDIDLGQYIEPQSFDLSGITDMLAENNIEANLELRSPNICLAVSNPIGVEVDGELQLVANYISGEPLAIDVPLHLNGAKDGQKGITRLCLTSNAASAPAGYTAIVPEGYDKLLNSIPSSLDLNINGSIDENSTCTIEIGDDYVFDIDLSLQLPMSLGSNTSVSYKTAFRDLDIFQDLEGLNISVNEIGILLESTSTLPLEFTVDAVPIDADSVKVEGIDLAVEGSIGGCADEYQPKVSRLLISVSGNTTDLAKVDGIALCLKADIGEKEEATLNGNQYLKARAIFSAKKGITANIADILNALNKEEDDNSYEE